MKRTPLVSGSRSTSGLSEIFEVAADAGLSLYLDVSAVSGDDPTLDVTFQESPDGGATWFDRAAFSRMTAAGREPLAVADGAMAGLSRIRYAIGGSDPSFTFGIIVVSAPWSR
ncbi:MAG: hypothetical protein ACREK5_06435 [Gemmatimonadota bacterium]